MQPWLLKLDISDLFDKPSKLSKESFGKLIKKKLREECEKELLQKMKNSKKIKEGPIFNSTDTTEETFGKKAYINELSLVNSRTNFAFRAKMYSVSFNFKNQGENAHNLWVCSSCQSSIETQEHVLFCPAYIQLREGKSLDSDNDLADYLRKVLIIREKLNIDKQSDSGF